MKTPEIVAFLKANVKPLDDSIYGFRYRAAARLKDGSYLPCVVFQSKRKVVDLALRRFDETRRSSREYRGVVESFVTAGNRLADWEVASVEPSPFAWEIEILRTIQGETTMGWTSFVAEMHDGSYVSLGTTFSHEFFDLPSGYTHKDIKTIHSGVVYGAGVGLKPFAHELLSTSKIYREKPYFTCYVEGLDA